MTDQPPSYQPPSYPPPSNQPPAYASNQPAAYPPPSYPNAPAYQGAPTGPLPGRVLGIVSLIGSIVLSVVSVLWLILGIVALVQSRRAGRGNGFAIAAIIISVLAIVATVIIVVLLIVGAANIAAFCAQNGPGTYQYGNYTITCS